MNKRGLSPLMATLILIGVSVALGTIVMNWGQGYIAEKAEFVQSANAAEVGCGGIGVQVVTIAGVPQLCRDGTQLQIFLENLANEPLHGLQARVTGLTDFVVHDDILGKPLGAAQSTHIRVPIEGVGDMLQVKLTPAIQSGDLTQFCLHDALIFEQPFRTC